MSDNLGEALQLGHNTIPLDDALAQKIRERFDDIREHKFELYRIARTLRQEHLFQNKYDDGFKDWYQNQKMYELFGKLPNFTKYAAAGDVVLFVERHVESAKFLPQLPQSVGALYEASQILASSEEIFDLCLRYTVTRASIDQPRVHWKTKKPALLHPQATEAQVRLWRLRWENPPPPKQARTDKRTLKFITITCSGELFDFDRKTGDKTGCLDLPEVEDFLRQVQALFTKENEHKFKITDDMEYLTDGYTRWKDKNDPARKIIEKKPAKNKYKN